MQRLLVLILCFVFHLSFAQVLTKEKAWAIKYGHTEYLDAWIPADEINACLEVEGSKKTYNYLAISIKLKSLKAVEYFVARGAQIEGICEVKTPLMFAAKYGQIEIAKYLMVQGADPRKKFKGYSSFDYARKFKHFDLYREMRRNL